MNKTTLRLTQAIKQNAIADRPTTINPDCSVSDIREQSGLSESEFHDAHPRAQGLRYDYPLVW